MSYSPIRLIRLIHLRLSPILPYPSGLLSTVLAFVFDTEDRQELPQKVAEATEGLIG